jgi:hypothetical protein
MKRQKLVDALEALLESYISNVESEYRVGAADDHDIVIKTRKILEEENKRKEKSSAKQGI